MLYEFDQAKLVGVARTEPTDEQLMARIQGRDEIALAVLYRRHTPILRTIIQNVVHNDYDADELLQEVFVQLWNAADRYKEKKGRALGWMVTLARRRAIDRTRRRQSYARMAERLRLETENESKALRHHRVEDEANAHDTAEFFSQLLATLPAPQQEALRLAFHRGWSQRQIAAQTGIPLGTIKTRIDLGMRKIRRALLTLGGPEEWSEANRAAWH
jgi:RNA polymerase sigma-70 factor (ECF subfamily)